MRRGLILMIALVGAGLGPTSAAGAPGDTQLRGAAGEVPVRLTVGYFGNATAFRIADQNLKCTTGKRRLRGRTHRDFFVSDPGSFRIRSRRTTRAGGLTLKIGTRILGAIAADNRTWSGIYKTTIAVFRGEERINTCRVRSVWHVF